MNSKSLQSKNRTESALYACSVTHVRTAPQANRFRYGTFLWWLDLAELDHLPDRLRLFGVETARPFTLRRQDYLPDFAEPDEVGSVSATLRSRVEAALGFHGLSIRPDEIRMLSSVRVLGFVFNPVTFYFCSHADSRLPTVLAEVTNTYGERKTYVVPAGSNPRRDKHFYISPFIKEDAVLHFRFPRLGERLIIRIDTEREGNTELKAVLDGRRSELSDRALMKFALRYPLATLAVVVRIHYQALKLFLKRVPYFSKSDSDRRLATG